jgi:hypothetical protein
MASAAKNRIGPLIKATHMGKNADNMAGIAKAAVPR